MINVVYAFSGEEYARLTVISMLSVLQSSNTQRIHFILLTDLDFHDRAVFDCIGEDGNCEISFYYVSEMFQDVELHIPHINAATYYRLALPDVLLSDKCIYLDSDTIVRCDLDELYRINIENYYIAGVLAVGYYTNPEKGRYCNLARIPDLEQYVNAGVLIMNLDRMRKDKLVNKFKKLTALRFPSQDQDIINKVCYGKILLLPFYYNVMTKYADWDIGRYNDAFPKEMIQEGWSYPRIIHYADEVKPWNCPSSVFGEYWWKICEKTPFRNFFWKNLGKRHVYESLYQSPYRMNGVIKRHTPRLYRLRNQKIIIYGAGIQAKQFLKLITSAGMKPEFIVVSQIEGNLSSIQGIKVIGKEQMSKNNKQLTLIVATSSKYHKEIIEGLSDYEFKEILTLDDRLAEWDYDACELSEYTEGNGIL